MFYCEFSLFIAQQKIDLNNTLKRIYELNLRNYIYQTKTSCTFKE